MSETGFSPQGLARTIAAREVGAQRVDRVLGKLEVLTHDYVDKKTARTANQLKQENPPTEIGKGLEGTPDEFQAAVNRQAAERLAIEHAQSWGGRTQGEYEKAINDAKTEEQKQRVQENFAEQFNPTDEFRKEMYGYRDEFGEKHYATPLETTHGLAMVENQLFDGTRDQMATNGEINDPQHLTPEENQSILKRVDNQVRSIGMTLLRGMVIPNPFGQVLVDKALDDAAVLIRKTDKSIRENTSATQTNQPAPSQ